jgi:hypothetical protein
MSREDWKPEIKSGFHISARGPQIAFYPGPFPPHILPHSPFCVTASYALKTSPPRGPDGQSASRGRKRVGRPRPALTCPTRRWPPTTCRTPPQIMPARSSARPMATDGEIASPGTKMPRAAPEAPIRGTGRSAPLALSVWRNDSSVLDDGQISLRRIQSLVTDEQHRCRGRRIGARTAFSRGRGRPGSSTEGNERLRFLGSGTPAANCHLGPRGLDHLVGLKILFCFFTNRWNSCMIWGGTWVILMIYHIYKLFSGPHMSPQHLSPRTMKDHRCPPRQAKNTCMKTDTLFSPPSS